MVKRRTSTATAWPINAADRVPAAARGAGFRVAAAATSNAAHNDLALSLYLVKTEAIMMELEWLKPVVLFGSILYALIGVAVFWICFLIVDKLTPYKLWDEITEKKNVALAIVVGSMCIAIGLIVAAAVHG
jgi:uncharacterized membrane protein YjfL (UPF0719 family)